MGDDLERLLIRREAWEIPRRGRAVVGSPAFLGQVTSTGTNIAAGKFLLVNPVVVTGAEAEGGTPTYTVDTSRTVPVYLARGTPATGDYLLCRRADHRWVAEPGRLGGSGGTGVTGCATYQVRVLDTAGNPVSGLAVTMNRQAGTPTSPAFSPTYAPITGTTDGSGTVSYSVPTSAPFNFVTGVTVGMPGNPAQTVANGQTTNVAGVCTFAYTLCIRARVINTTVSGVAISGNQVNWGVNCPTPGTFPYITVSGADHTYKHYTLTAINGNGTNGTSGFYGSSTGTIGQMPGGFGCLGGYWGGCVGTATVACGGTVTSTIQMIPSDGYLYNPAQSCLNDPTDVIQKACCVNFDPATLVGGGPFACAWDTSSWDGRGGDFADGMLVSGRPTMRFAGGSGGATAVVEISVAVSGAGGISDIRMVATGTDGTHSATASGAVGSWGDGATHTAGVAIRAGYVAALNNITVTDGPCGAGMAPPSPSSIRPAEPVASPTDPPATPAMAPPAPGLMPVAEATRLALARNACPHGSRPPDCGCGDDLVCDARDGARVSRQDCYRCLAPPTDPAP